MPNETVATGAGQPLPGLCAIVAAGSHDLRGPAHHLQAYARLLRDDAGMWDAERQRFIIDRLVAAADRVSAQFNSIALWAKAEQGTLGPLEGEDEPVSLVLEEFAEPGALLLVPSSAVVPDTPCPALLLRMALAQLAAWAGDAGTELPLTVHVDRDARPREITWTLAWRGPRMALLDPAGVSRHGKGATGRAELHLGALRALAGARGGTLEECEGPDGLSDYRLTLTLC